MSRDFVSDAVLQRLLYWPCVGVSCSISSHKHARRSVKARHNKRLDVCVSNSVRFNRPHSTMVLAGLFGAFSGFGIAMMTNATRKIPLSRGDYIIVKSFLLTGLSICPTLACSHFLFYIHQNLGTTSCSPLSVTGLEKNMSRPRRNWPKISTRSVRTRDCLRWWAPTAGYDTLSATNRAMSSTRDAWFDSVRRCWSLPYGLLLVEITQNVLN